MTNTKHPARAAAAPAATGDTYVLGRSEAETRRLIRQSRFHNPFTRRLLEEAGLSEGMKVLDVGSGAGCGERLGAKAVGAPSIHPKAGVLPFSAFKVREELLRNHTVSGYVLPGVSEERSRKRS
jgi:hypothetical protein